MYNNPGAVPPESEGHGLRFLNEEWNETISNGHAFTLEWNQTVDKTKAELGLFRITYPEDGVMQYEWVKNLTDQMDSNRCEWTPDNLNDDLFAMWLTTSTDGNQTWTVSPPWKLKNYRNHGLHWAAPVGIPIVVILGIYALSLVTCLWYRRRRRLRFERQSVNRRHSTNSQSSDIEDPSGRHPSVSSVETALTYDEPDFKKPDTAVLLSHEHRNRLSAEREPLRGVRRSSTWEENVHFDGVRFDEGRQRKSGDDDVLDQPRRPEDMYVAPGTAI